MKKVLLIIAILLLGVIILGIMTIGELIEQKEYKSSYYLYQKPKWYILVDEQRYLPDGHSIRWSLSPGEYKIQVISDEGIRVGAWDGKVWLFYTDETRSYYNTFKIRSGGGIIVQNPSWFGLGRGANIHVKVWIWQ